VPELSRFLGIVITMYYRDHGPPHFHASYGEFDVEVTIEDGLVSASSRSARYGTFWSGTISTSPSCGIAGL
jgi:hypothetical protein